MKVFGIDFYKGAQADLIQAVKNDVNQSFGYVVTANVNHVVQLEHDVRFRMAYDAAAYRICDSRVLMPALRKFRAGVPEAIPGSTLTVVGSTDDVLHVLAQQYPAVTFLHYNPPMGFIDNPEQVEATIAFVEQHRAQLIIFSVGSPRQELLCKMIADRGRAHGVGLCTGAALNFLSGKVQRAPMWVQKLSLEWLHRILSEPRRLAGRYWHDGRRILPIILRQYSQQRQKP
jgi:N-acetylglucosaminyldiphosphoundecaprenol N-acetyl-beta-D-mannosaminyltransferase